MSGAWDGQGCVAVLRHCCAASSLRTCNCCWPRLSVFRAVIVEFRFCTRWILCCSGLSYLLLAAHRVWFSAACTALCILFVIRWSRKKPAVLTLPSGISFLAAAPAEGATARSPRRPRRPQWASQSARTARSRQRAPALRLVRFATSCVCLVCPCLGLLPGDAPLLREYCLCWAVVR